MDSKQTKILMTIQNSTYGFLKYRPSVADPDPLVLRSRIRIRIRIRILLSSSKNSKKNLGTHCMVTFCLFPLKNYVSSKNNLKKKFIFS
jgi:hypothetical protein